MRFLATSRSPPETPGGFFLHLPPARRQRVTWELGGPPFVDVTAFAAIVPKKGCSRMLSRWAAALSDAALQV